MSSWAQLDVSEGLSQGTQDLEMHSMYLLVKKLTVPHVVWEKPYKSWEISLSPPLGSRRGKSSFACGRSCSVSSELRECLSYKAMTQTSAHDGAVGK